MWAAIIGVAGTLLGTVLGWILNNLSKAGKLNVFLCSWDPFYYSHDNAGFKIRSKNENEARRFSYELVLDFYNSGGETKAMRDIKVIFNDGNMDVYISHPKDKHKTFSKNNKTLYERLSSINVLPKSIVQISVFDDIGETESGKSVVLKAKKVYLEYSDEKAKKQRGNLLVMDSAKYFERLMQENTNNG